MPRHIVVAHYYLNGREVEAARGEYPRSHLWGIRGLTEHGFQVRLLSRPPTSSGWRWLSRMTRGAFGNLAEWAEIRREARGADAVYLVSGLHPMVRRDRVRGKIRCPIFTWLYDPPSAAPERKLHSFLPCLRGKEGIDGYLCLTRAAERYAREKRPGVLARYIPWGADTEMFRPASQRVVDRYVLACGRNGRDFKTLLEAARSFPGPLRLIAPRSEVEGGTLPPNVTFLGGPRDAGTDEGVSYRQLAPEMAGAFCHVICLRDHPQSAAGFTNLLEALAVGRPVIMTRTGCLDIDVERERVGFHVPPGNARALRDAVQRLWANPALADEMGRAARALIERRFTLEQLDAEVVAFFEEGLGAIPS